MENEEAVGEVVCAVSLANSNQVLVAFGSCDRLAVLLIWGMREGAAARFTVDSQSLTFYC